VPAALTRRERDALVRQLRELESQLYPDESARAPSRRESALLWESWYSVTAEYADRLPRIVMGACPFTSAPLVRAFDPFGLDGPFWWRDRPFAIDEPDPPAHFRVLLGALSLGGRTPAETVDEVIPGPDVPFVVPQLLDLPEMRAVIMRLELETGDVAYPISYWSTEAIPGELLHQPWLRQELWIDHDGGAGWMISTEPWDFELSPWIEREKLYWFEPGSARPFGRADERPCPFLGLPGDRRPQSLAGGERALLDLPDGEMIEPFPTDE